MKCIVQNCERDCVTNGQLCFPCSNGLTKDQQWHKVDGCLPKCDCGTKLTVTQVREGNHFCVACRERIGADEKWSEFEDAGTVEELKDWIREYML